VAFSEGDKAIIKEVAWEIGDVVVTRIKEDVSARIKLHIADCPVKDKVDALVNKSKGAWAVIIVIAGAVGSVVAIVITHYWK
jgi:hypothetical protein